MESANPALHFVNLEGSSILQQLQLEEALLRADERNWCIVNRGVRPAVVLGISAKPEQWLNHQLLSEQPLPVIRRFTGGGTVVVDENTLFVTFVCNEHAVKTAAVPKDVLEWSASFYKNVFKDSRFLLKENDYALEDRKFGGNAQYLRKARWLHHTSFLWDYHPDKMAYLKMPPKMPAYRKERHHTDFLCKMKEFISHPDQFIENVKDELKNRFTLLYPGQSDIEAVLDREHRKATVVMELIPESKIKK